MSSVLRQFIDRFYPSRENEHTITILGLENTGKTTLLYYLLNGKIVTTIPTIGFNVETVKAPTSDGNPLALTCWDVGTGCGIQYLYRILSVYTVKSDALIWMVDGSEPTYLDESFQALSRVLLDMEMDFGGPRNGYPVLVLVNKLDKPSPTSIETVRLKFSTRGASRHVLAVFGTSLTAPSTTETGIIEAFTWLKIALESGQRAALAAAATASNHLSIAPPPPRQPIPDPRTPSLLYQKLDSWLTRVFHDSEPLDFLHSFETVNLPAWDHYTHIRIAYVILTTYGRQRGKDMIFSGLERYITTSPQTRGRTFHVTMTYFWIQIVHFGIRSMAPLPPSANSRPGESETGPPSMTATTNANTSRTPTPNEFARFLLLNPHVVDGNLWTDYYSKEVMMSPEAKAAMVLPDRKPLPSLVVRDSVSTSIQIR